jgi:hypothetical protein
MLSRPLPISRLDLYDREIYSQYCNGWAMRAHEVTVAWEGTSQRAPGRSCINIVLANIIYQL